MYLQFSKCTYNIVIKVFPREHFLKFLYPCHPERRLAIGLTNRKTQSRDLLFADTIRAFLTTSPNQSSVRQFRVRTRACILLPRWTHEPLGRHHHL